MKRVILTVLAYLLSITLVGCGEGEDGGIKVKVTTEEEENEEKVAKKDVAEVEEEVVEESAKDTSMETQAMLPPATNTESEDIPPMLPSNSVLPFGTEEPSNNTDKNKLSSMRYGLAAVTLGSIAKKVFFAGGVYNQSSKATTVVDIYDSLTETWTKANLAQGRTKLAAVTLGDKVFFAGGQMGPLTGITELSNIVDIYDSTNNTWSLATLSKARHSLFATTVGNKVIFSGGINSENKMETIIDIYNSGTNTWTTADALSSCNDGVRVTTSSLKAYFTCGYSTLTSVSSSIVAIYDSEADTWSTATLSQARSPVDVKAVGSKVLFAGGKQYINYNLTYSDIVDIYDSETDTWSVATLSQARISMTSVAIGSKVIFAGGEKPSEEFFMRMQALNAVDIYNSETDTWSTGTLAQARSNIATVNVGTKVFFAGGMLDNRELSSIIDVYDSATNTWSVLTFAEARSEMMAVQISDTKIMFAGGKKLKEYTSTDEVRIYDTATNKWIQK